MELGRRGQRVPGFGLTSPAAGLDQQFVVLLMELEGNVRAARVARNGGGQRLETSDDLGHIGRRATHVFGHLDREVDGNDAKSVGGRH